MAEQHPIAPPPPELVEKWYNAVDNSSTPWRQQLATKAARWGADQELEACCEVVTNATVIPLDSGQWLYSRRRPKPPSLKKQALHALLHIDQGQHNERCRIIRRALEQLDD